MSSSKRSPKRAEPAPTSSSSQATTRWRKTAPDSKETLHDEDAAIVAAALAKLNIRGLPQDISSEGAKGERSQVYSTSPASSSKPSSSLNNRAARRQQARKREKAKKEKGNDEKEEPAEQAEEEDVVLPLNLGFMPEDEPLSSTDEEAEDADKELEERILRSRKVGICACKLVGPV